ncbi:reticulon-1-like isoform X1 [Sinocyclocheilus anshuiensis]|uniref:reticulon-1-like isoform X1 n=1 Tax=Sinocyclocheilus anshuiensis TaxID=1608454 RepID=UPI0007BA2CED|nr:PREDICTED: reticulon-1-like isoform X1 [Sinocyclocheilus anshuiensis]
MEEADRVSSTAPDGAPRDIIMSEAAAVARKPADETLRSAEEHSPENTNLTNLTTAQITSAPQTTEVTSAPTEVNSTPQTTEETSTTTEVTSAPQMTEETSTPTEVTSAPQITEDTSTPQKTEVTSAPTEITSTAQTTEITSTPGVTEEAITPQRSEDASAPQISEESLTNVTQIAEISSTWQITEETSPPEPAEESCGPAASEEPPETAGAPSSSSEPEPELREESVTAAQEEAPRASRSEHREPSPSHEPEPSVAAAVAPALLQFPSDRFDSPPVASRASANLAMDPLGHKDSAAFDPDVLSQSNDDFMFEMKKSTFQAFPPVSESLEETTAARRSVEVSESPSPDLVQDAYDEGHVPSEELKPETDADASVSLSYVPSDLYSNINTASDDRPTSLPDILKSSPLNPDKLDSGSSEGSPDFSPVHRSVDNSPNSPFTANSPFGFDSKILLLKEMAEETEVRAMEMAKLETENNSEQSFTAFDLVKETEVPPKSDALLKDKEVISQTAVQTADRFECLGFPGGNTREPSDSESPSADSFSPVLDAVMQERRAIQGAMDTAEEASEQEVSFEEFEFVERSPQGAAEEFLEMQDSLAFSKPSEMPQDEDRSPKLEPQEVADHTPTIEDADKQSSYHLLTQASDKPSPARGKAVLESDFQEISPAPVIRPPADKPRAEEKEAEGSMCDPSAAAVLELLYWRDVRASGLVLGCSLFLLLSLLSCSIISVLSYSALALLSLTLSFRTYRGVLQAVQKSDEGHPFKRYLDQDVALSKDVVQRHSDVVLSQINGALKELRRLFLVEDLIDSLKFAVFLWVLTYVGAWFNGLTLLILGLIGAFSGPIVYETHQTQIDQFIFTLKSRVKDVKGQIQAKVPGAKKKSE